MVQQALEHMATAAASAFHTNGQAVVEEMQSAWSFLGRAHAWDAASRCVTGTGRRAVPGSAAAVPEAEQAERRRPAAGRSRVRAGAAAVSPVVWRRLALELLEAHETGPRREAAADLEGPALPEGAPGEGPGLHSLSVHQPAPAAAIWVVPEAWRPWGAAPELAAEGATAEAPLRLDRCRQHVPGGPPGRVEPCADATPAVACHHRRRGGAVGARSGSAIAAARAARAAAGL